MGRKQYFARQAELAKERRHKQLEKSGYIFGAHAQDDSIRDKDKRIPETKRRYLGIVVQWKDFAEQNGIIGFGQSPGSMVPDYQLIKEFIRWYIHGTRGRVSDNGRPTVKTVLLCAERLFGGFEEDMQLSIPQDDRSEVYNWIRKSLTAEGTIEKIENPNRSFSKKDFLRTVSSLWQTDHRRFIPGPLKVIILLALQLYLFTGARIGAFIPETKNKHERGLRYKHIILVLFPSSKAPWKVGWKVDQVWLKNNRDPKYTVFGIGIRDSKRPQFAAGYMLLALALQHGALYGINTVDDLAQCNLSNGGPMELHWKDEYLEKPVLRNVTAGGPQDVPLDTVTFCECLRAMFTAAGYEKTPTVHEIRKNLGKVIEANYGSAPVSQIYGHKGAGTYPKDYQLHCSSIDTVSAILEEDEQTDHIEYFQGFDRFYERGLPGELPAEILESICAKPEMKEMRDHIKELEDQSDHEQAIAIEKRKYNKALIRDRLSELKRYQSHWVRQRRDQRILNRGKEEPVYSESDISTRAQGLIMPEGARIARSMSCTEELSFDKMLLFVQDVQMHCERDFDVIYLPKQGPVRGVCPAKNCQLPIEKLQRSQRSAHIHECVRREKSFDLQIAEEGLRFCYECMDWFLLNDWRGHCETHLQSWQTRHCEVLVFRHTVIRPGYCPFCLWNMDLPAEDRLHYWLKSGNLKQHIEERHLPEFKWPTKQPICGCTQTFDNERGLRYHLHDIHGLNKAIWQNPKLPRKRKRVCKMEGQKTSTEAELGPPKKTRFYRYPPPRHEHEFQLSDSVFIPIPTLHSFVEEHPEQYFHSSLKDNSTESGRSSPVVSCFSQSSSPCSSVPTTPGLEEFIDPRILEPSTIDKKKGPPPCDQLFLQADPLREHEIKAKSSGDATRPQSPGQSLAVQPDSADIRTLDTLDLRAEEDVGQACVHVTSQPNLLNCSPSGGEVKPILSDMGQSLYSPASFVSSEANENEALLKESVTLTSDSNERSSTKFEGTNHPPTHQDKTMHRGEDRAISLRGPLTRAQARQQPTEHCPDDLEKDKSQKKLNAKDKRKLRDFKSQKMTLGQIGPHFPDINIVFLRQAWTNIRISDRCTRSRVK